MPRSRCNSGLVMRSCLYSSAAKASSARRDRSPPDAVSRLARSSGICTVTFTSCRSFCLNTTRYGAFMSRRSEVQQPNPLPLRTIPVQNRKTAKNEQGALGRAGPIGVRIASGRKTVNTTGSTNGLAWVNECERWPEEERELYLLLSNCDRFVDYGKGKMS